MKASRFVFAFVLMSVVACGGDAEEAPAPTEENGTDVTQDTSDTTQAASETTAPTEPSETEGTPGDEERSGSATIGTQSPSIIRIPTIMAVERMNDLGYELEFVEFDSSSTQIQAAVSGAIDIPTAAAAGQMTAMDAGYEGDLFMVMYINEFTLVSSGDFTTCESLDGQSVAIHAQTSADGLIARAWFDQTCPEAEPNLVVVEGSENRLVALLEDQVSAATLGLDNLTQLQNEHPDEFNVVGNFVEEYPTYAGSFSATPDFLSENEQMVKDLIQIHLEVWDELYSDPEILLREAEELLPEIEPDVLALMVDNYIEAGIFPTDGGLDPELTELTMNVASDAVGGFESVDSVDEVMDRSLLDSVLAER